MATGGCCVAIDHLDGDPNIRDRDGSEMDRKVAADHVEGRIIRMSFDVTLTPQDTTHCGHSDMAYEIGKGLIREAILLIRDAGEKEGFKVQIDYGQMVY